MGYRPSAFGWLQNRRGIYSFITEFWNPLKAARVDLTNTLQWTILWRFHPVEDEEKLLRWSAQEFGRDGFARPPDSGRRSIRCPKVRYD